MPAEPGGDGPSQADGQGCLVASGHQALPCSRAILCNNVPLAIPIPEEGEMPKYLFQASYTAEGVRGILKEGGSSRRDHIAELARGLGGTLESFYFAFGGTDAFVIAELPDNATAAAVSLAVGHAPVTLPARRHRFGVVGSPHDSDPFLDTHTPGRQRQISGHARSEARARL